jgi:hypothetical protein
MIQYGDTLHMLPMLVIKRRMNIIKQLGKEDNACQRPLGITQLSKNKSSKNIIRNIFDVDLHHDSIKV